VRFGLGMMYERKKDYVRAREEYTLAMQRIDNEGKAEVTLRLAMLCKHMGFGDQALQVRLVRCALSHR
jgi:hypothetical protein